MKTTRKTAKIGAYIGGITGVVLFAIVGLLPSSLIGGLVGVNIASGIFGTPVDAAILPRLIVGVSMMLGIAVAGLFFVVGAMTLGWAAGYAIEGLRHSKADMRDLAAEHK